MTKNDLDNTKLDLKYSTHPYNPVQLPLPSGLCRAVCPILMTVPKLFSPELPSPPAPILIPILPSFWDSGSCSADVGLGSADAQGLDAPGVFGLRKFDAGVYNALTRVSTPSFPGDGVTGRNGGGALRTGKYDSAYHSYQILDFPVTLHTETWSSELLGR